MCPAFGKAWVSWAQVVTPCSADSDFLCAEHLHMRRYAAILCMGMTQARWRDLAFCRRALLAQQRLQHSKTA